MDELRMTAKERIRLDAVNRVKRGETTLVAAAELAGLSPRQMRRVWKRFKAEGDKGLTHRLRGRASNRRLSDDLRARVVKLHQEKYADFGPTLACEKLAEAGLPLCPNTLTAFLKERGLWERRRRRGRHRKRRERRACFGSMVQMDGSHHDWFEGRGAECVLMVLIDDATNTTFARFFPAETTEAAFDVFGRWTERRGLPRALYVDRHSIYRDEDRPEKSTQFGRAMKELGVELILARSPQAKGRVERRHGVFQDRLVKELRLRNINGLTQANLFLENFFLDDLNRRLAVAAAQSEDLHRPLGAGVSLAEVLCVREERTVGNDGCVRWRNRFLQIDSAHAGLNLPRRKVAVRELADGRLTVEHQGGRLRFTELAARPAPSKRRKGIVNNRRWKPEADHPWRGVPPSTPASAAPARGLRAGSRAG
jgi:hypothetical protein